MTGEVQHLFWDESSGRILNTDGAIFAFHEFPERPCEFKTFAEAKAYLGTVTGAERPFELHVANLDWEDL